MGIRQLKVKKIIILSIAILFIFILALFIWLILPGPENTLTEVILPNTFAYASLKISLTDSGVSDLMNNLSLTINNPAVKRKERFLIKFIMPLFLPVEVATTFILNPDTKNPDYLVFVKNNRLAQIFRIFALLKLKPIKGHIFTIFKDIIVVSKQLPLAEMALNSYKQRPTFLSSGVLDDFWSLRDTKDVALFINNTDSYFSQFIKYLEKKNTYIIFPTVDSIKWISGYIDILNSDKAKGSLIFKYKELTDVAEVKKDIHFFAEIFRRCFRANGLNFTQEMISHSDFIDLNFEVSGLRIFMVGLLTKEKEGY